jgi:multidrug efflux system membrane fusion protein
MARLNKIRAGIVIVSAGICGWYLIHHFTAKKAQPPQAIIPVTPGKVTVKDVPIYVRGLGTVQAFNTVMIKSRVDGPITQVRFTEGQEVKAGDPLFQIDPRPYQATLEQAQANLQKDQAQLQGAELDLARFTKLAVPGFQTRQSVDDQKAMVGQIQGSAKADQALIDSSQLNLDYTNIRSPITGRTGARLVDIGNFIQAAQGTNLVTVTQLKPIFVTFTVPQDALDAIRLNQVNGPLSVIAYAADDKTMLAEGKLTLINNQVDPTTGTIQLKGTFDNNDERLWPGEFVNARIIISVHRDALTVPAQTVMQGPNGPYAYTIKPDQTVQRQPVDVSLTQDGEAVIDKGLAADDNIVVDGQYRLTQGVRIKTDSPAPQPPAS